MNDGRANGGPAFILQPYSPRPLTLTLSPEYGGEGRRRITHTSLMK